MSRGAVKYGLGPNGRPVRPFIMPKTWRGKLAVWRYIILRRITQLTVLLLFLGTIHWGWEVAGRALLVGNLSASELLGIVPLADPFATLQILLTRHLVNSEILIGAAIILVFYALLGGRVWCSWVCPINMVTDLAAWLRSRLDIRDMFRLTRNIRYTVLVLALLLSAITGVAAFEWVSPISMLHRELIFGAGLGWMAVLGVFLFDLLVLRHGWCGHLCPLGAFYALLGRFAPLRVRFDAPTCTHCVECVKVCPEPQVLNLKRAATVGMIGSGECSNCGRCITVCPEGTLSFDWRALIDTHNRNNPSEQNQRRAA
ncbi:MAG: quinol dehydrogenase ferredoxin subunit NapH [Pseudomonadota bacterium]